MIIWNVNITLCTVLIDSCLMIPKWCFARKWRHHITATQSKSQNWMIIHQTENLILIESLRTRLESNPLFSSSWLGHNGSSWPGDNDNSNDSSLMRPMLLMSVMTVSLCVRLKVGEALSLSLFLAGVGACLMISLWPSHKSKESLRSSTPPVAASSPDQLLSTDPGAPSADVTRPHLPPASALNIVSPIFYRGKYCQQPLSPSLSLLDRDFSGGKMSGLNAGSRARTRDSVQVSEFDWQAGLGQSQER